MLIEGLSGLITRILECKEDIYWPKYEVNFNNQNYYFIDEYELKGLIFKTKYYLSDDYWISWKRISEYKYKRFKRPYTFTNNIREVNECKVSTGNPGAILSFMQGYSLRKFRFIVEFSSSPKFNVFYRNSKLIVLHNAEECVLSENSSPKKLAKFLLGAPNYGFDADILDINLDKESKRFKSIKDNQ